MLTIAGNPVRFTRKFFVEPALVTLVVLLAVGCSKSSDAGPPPPNPELASVSTEDVNTISQTTGLGGGIISSDGGSAVTVFGICWNTTKNPTTADSKTIVGKDLGIYGFTGFATGLSPATTYYVRAFATNSVGTAYGNEVSFTTLQVNDTIVTDIDGNTYKTITIGTQVWMSENLKTIHYRNGDEADYGLNEAGWQSHGSNAIGACTVYGTFANNDVYGKIYNWFAVTDSRKIAPYGWHVPTENEWQTLISFLGGSTTAGLVMKEAGLTHWISPNTGATNSSGFNGLPGGYRNTDGTFDFMGSSGWWWSTTASTAADEAEALGLFTGLDEANMVTGKKSFGTSVRCIKD